MNLDLAKGFHEFFLQLVSMPGGFWGLPTVSEYPSNTDDF